MKSKVDEFPEPPDLLSVKCNLEPEWLSKMAEGVLGEIGWRNMMFLIGPILPGPLLLLLGPSFRARRQPFHIRLWRGIKRALHLR